MKRKILLTVLIVVISLVVAFGTFAGTTYALYTKEKKAVIILPGLFASGLYDSETGKAVWDPFEDLDVYYGDIMPPEGGINFGKIAALLLEESVADEVKKIMANQNYGEEDSLLNLMAVNEDGTPAVPSVVGVPWYEYEGRIKYGAINAQKQMYFSIYEKYKDDYNVEIFNYDFRRDNRYTAELLEDYINQKGYKEIILVSHSNGGHVAAIYLARSQANRDKVKKYISYNAPYLGSFSAIRILENLDTMIPDMVAGIPDFWKKALKNIFNNLEDVFNKQFMKILNMWTVYHLLPNYELLTNEYDGEQAAYYFDGERKIFENEQELYEFYCSRPWARHENGELKPAMIDWLDYIDSLKVTLPSGEKVYSPTLVDTTYFAGMDCEGPNKVYFETKDDALVMTDAQTTTKGDGTVLLTSAVAFEEDLSKITFWHGVNHVGVNTYFEEYCQEDTYAAIDKSIDKPSWYYSMWFKILKK